MVGLPCVRHTLRLQTSVTQCHKLEAAGKKTPRKIQFLAKDKTLKWLRDMHHQVPKAKDVKQINASKEFQTGAKHR
jgi:hypothetical protein